MGSKKKKKKMAEKKQTAVIVETEPLAAETQENIQTAEVPETAALPEEEPETAALPAEEAETAALPAEEDETESMDDKLTEEISGIQEKGLEEDDVTESFEEDLEDTKLMTEEVRAALKTEEEEELRDAKIRQSVNEAADEFREDQEVVLAGSVVAEEFTKSQRERKPYQQNAKEHDSNMEGRTMEEYNRDAEYNRGTEYNRGAEYNRGTEYNRGAEYNRDAEYSRGTGNNRGAEKGRNEEYGKRETAEVKTVYLKEKEKTGWWKIVMLVLTCIITISFCATALFAGLGAFQLSKIADRPEPAVYQSPLPGYGPAETYDQGNGSNSPESSGSYAPGYDIDVEDIIDFFNGLGGNGNNGAGDYNDNNNADNNNNNNRNDNNANENNNNNGSNSNNNNNNNNGSNNKGTDNSGGSSDFSIIDWFSGLFGNSGNSELSF